jgi:DNA-directed RNA polymerase subunit RPC12/RpoP
MTTWSSKYKCTDCGRDLESPGTCNACIRAAERLVEAVKKDRERAKGKRK